MANIKRGPVVDKLTGIFSMMADPGNNKGVDDFIRDHNLLAGLTGAVALGHLDGDDGVIMSGIKGAIDFWAMQNVASGQQSFLSQAWLALRAGDVSDEMTKDQGFLARWGAWGAAVYGTWTGIDAWENVNEQALQKRAAAPAPAP